MDKENIDYDKFTEGFRLHFQFRLRHHAEQNLTAAEHQAAAEGRLNISAKSAHIYADDVAVSYYLATVEEVD